MNYLLLSTVLLITQGVSAQPIYKSVDHKGQVSYSSSPGKSAVKVETVAAAPSPNPLEVERARQRLLDWEAREAEAEKIRQQKLEQKREKLHEKQLRNDLKSLKNRIEDLSARQESNYRYRDTRDLYWDDEPNYTYCPPYQPQLNYQPAPITRLVSDPKDPSNQPTNWITIP